MFPYWPWEHLKIPQKELECVAGEGCLDFPPGHAASETRPQVRGRRCTDGYILFFVDHISYVIASLHWLPVRFRLYFKIILAVYIL